MHSSEFSDSVGHLTFALVLVPRVDAVLHTVAHQRVVDAHVAVTEECVCITRSCRDTWKICLHLKAFLFYFTFLKCFPGLDVIVIIQMMLGGAGLRKHTWTFVFKHMQSR